MRPGIGGGRTIRCSLPDQIFDRSDALTRPVVAFTGFLDKSILEDGQPVQGDYLAGGPLPAGTVLEAGKTYQVTGVIEVPIGETLVVPGGTTLSFLPDARLDVAGTLLAQPGATFSSAEVSPAQDAWRGIAIASSSTGTVLDGVTIEFANEGVVVDGGACGRLELHDSGVPSFGSDVRERRHRRGLGEHDPPRPSERGNGSEAG